MAMIPGNVKWKIVYELCGIFKKNFIIHYNHIDVNILVYYFLCKIMIYDK